LPPGEVRPVAGRGEIFLRYAAPSDRALVKLPVVLLHGWQATADLNFFPLYEPLAAERVVVAPDLRGHGRTFAPEEPFTLEDAADDVAALLHDLGITRAVVLGYSLGTAVTQMLVARHPDLVAGIVLMGGEFRPDRRPHEKVYDRLGGWLATAQRMTNGRRGAHRIVTKTAVENPDVEHWRGWLVREIERGHVGALRAAGRALARFDGQPIVAAHRAVPAAVVVTERDHLVRPERQRTMAKAWDATLVELDADHDAPLARPAAFVVAAQEALAAVDAEILEHVSP
jgi:3-oxoadipate enol-lactonase